MKDLFFILSILILVGIIGFMLYENESIKNTNNELRTRTYYYKQELSKMKQRWLTELAKGN